MLKTINLNFKKILLLFALVFLSTASNVKAQALTCDVARGLPLSGETILPKLTINSSYSGYVRLVDTNPAGACGTSIILPLGSLQIGYLGSFTYTMTFKNRLII